MSEQCAIQKITYDPPTVDIFRFPGEDVMTVSGNGDSNQGEWDEF